MKLSIEEIYSIPSIEFDLSFQLANECSKLIRSDHEGIGREVIIAVIDNWEKVNRETREIWLDLIEASGFYPYLKIFTENDSYSTSQQIRRNYHVSENIKNIVFHREQKQLLRYINQGKNLVVSAPTSFGKSLLIEEIIASKIHNNIVIIQPTLALISETYKKLKKYEEEYNIIVKTNQIVEEKSKNIFIFTAERVMEYHNLPQIDFVILDEFYKLSAQRDDERSDVLNNAANLMLNIHKAQFYFLGPNIDEISEGFEEKYEAVFYKTNYSLVNNQIIDLYSLHEKKLTSSGKIKFKENLLFDLLIDLKDSPTIIYCSSPGKANKLATSFLKYLEAKRNLKLREKLELINWIDENISSDWSFNKILSHGIGVHNGALPKHINDSIIDYFNSFKLNYLFCTSTIIEGVNTTAKNVVIFDDMKGGKPIDFFDFNNIKGRSGRMMQHFLGRVYLLNKVPEVEKISIDIPFFDQINITDEILINLERDEIKEERKERYEQLPIILEEFFDVVKSNNISIEGQINIIDVIQKEIVTNPQNILWTGIPSYNQLKFIVELGWVNLLKEGESTNPMTMGKLAYITNNYGKKNGFIEAVKSEYKYQRNLTSNRKKDENAILDQAILFTMQAHRHWIKYKVPKWLHVINNLQKEVCISLDIEPGNYSLYASLLENDFVSSNLSLLIDLGVPSSALLKIERLIPKEIPANNVISYIKTNQKETFKILSEYEKQKIENLF